MRHGRVRGMSRSAINAALRRARSRVSLAVILCMGVLLVAHTSSVLAVEAIVVKPEQDKIDITALGELHEKRGDRLQIDTAPGQDGYIGRMAVQATTAGTDPGWLVFAL